MSAILQERVHVRTPRHVEVVHVSQIVVQLIYQPPPTSIHCGRVVCDGLSLFR